MLDLEPIKAELAKVRGDWRVEGKTHEGDGAAGVLIQLGSPGPVAFISHWTDRGEPRELIGDELTFANLIQQMRNVHVPALIAEVERLHAENERLCASQREAEEQLCRIASHLGTDARDAPEGDRTIAGLAITAVKRLREALTWAVGYIRCQKPNAETDYPDMRNAVDLMQAAPLWSGEFHRMMCCASVAEEEARQLRVGLLDIALAISPCGGSDLHGGWLDGFEETARALGMDPYELNKLLEPKRNY